MIISKRGEFAAQITKYINSVATEEDSPASKAGLKSGDRIISVEDEEIETADQLKNKIQE